MRIQGLKRGNTARKTFQISNISLTQYSSKCARSITEGCFFAPTHIAIPQAEFDSQYTVQLFHNHQIQFTCQAVYVCCVWVGLFDALLHTRNVTRHYRGHTRHCHHNSGQQLRCFSVHTSPVLCCFHNPSHVARCCAINKYKKNAP